MQKFTGLESDPPRAIRACLEYLYAEAMQNDLRLAAHLIGAAEESIVDLLDETESDSSSPSESEIGQKRNAKPDKEDKHNDGSRS